MRDFFSTRILVILLKRKVDDQNLDCSLFLGTKKYYERNKVKAKKEIVEEMESFDEDDW